MTTTAATTTTTPEVESEVARKRIYVGNLGSNVTKDDLAQLFGLETTPFLQKTCSVDLATDAKTGKSKNFAIVTVPEHVHSELMKLNGIEFYGKQVVIEEAKTRADHEKENNGKKGPRKGRNQGKGRGRGGRPGFRRWGPRKDRFDLPVLAPEETFSLVDCGVNLTNPKFHSNTDYVIARALAAGVQKMVITGLKLVGAKSACIMSKTRPNILFAAVGVHPHFVKDDWNAKTLEQLEELVKQPECVAVGEVGLDFKRKYSPEEQQMSTFKEQVQLAVTYNKALLVHERESHQQILDVLNEFKSLPPVVMHCFTGTAEQIKTYVAKGFYIGVTGFVCKEKHGADLRAAIKDGTLPLKNILVQTNAPYMTPNMPEEKMDATSKMLMEHCFADNEPCTLSIVVRCIAKCLETEPKKIAEQLVENALNVFRFEKAAATFE